jgi:hypothetical protein
MPLPVPTLPTVTFDSGNQTKLYVGLASTYDESEGLGENDELPVVGGDITFAPSGSVESIPVYGNAWDRAVKNGLSGTFNATTHAPGDNDVVAALLTAAQAVGSDAQVVFILELPDGGYLSGAAVVNDFQPNTPVRGVFSYTFNFTTDGEITYTAPGGTEE